MADVFNRVSIRKFKAQAVSNEDIGYILEAAMAAPSAKNQQPWEFYVVENREVLKQLGESSPFSGIYVFVCKVLSSKACKFAI